MFMYTSAGAVSCCSEVPWQGASCLLHGHQNDDKLDSVMVVVVVVMMMMMMMMIIVVVVAVV